MTIADILSPALAVFTEPALLATMLLGMGMGMLFGATPGLGGKMGILLLLPMLFGMDAEIGIVLLLSMHAVVHTGGSIPSILVGVPGGAPEAATVLDGFPMARRGEAAEALGASMAASGIGGALGALAYFLLLPVFAGVGHLLGAPEVLLLALIGLCAVSSLSQGSTVKGFAMAALGLLAGTVGLDSVTATPRYTFGQLELWDGLDLLILVTGMFAVPELLDIARKKNLLPPGEVAAIRCTYRALFRGMAATWRHRWLTLRTTVIGIFIGMIPGLGAEVASWLSYGHAVQSAQDKSRFGQGAIEGVIAPETANNSKEGGSLLPTVVFGVPGSSTMALMIAGLAILGLPAGPTFLASEPRAAALIGWTVLWSNLAAVAAFLAVLPLVGKIVYLRIDIIAPIVLTIAVVGTTIDQTGWPPLALLFAVSLLGCFLHGAGWPRAPFILAFVMGRLAETSLIKTVAIYGWEALARWPTLLLVAALLILVFRGLANYRRRAGFALARGDAVFAALLAGGFAAAAATALGFPAEAQLLPVAAGIIGFVACGTLLIGHFRSAPDGGAVLPAMPNRALLGFGIFLAGIATLGALPGSVAYAAWHALVEMRKPWWWAAALAFAIALGVWLLFGQLMRLPLLQGLL